MRLRSYQILPPAGCHPPARELFDKNIEIMLRILCETDLWPLLHDSHRDADDLPEHFAILGNPYGLRPDGRQWVGKQGQFLTALVAPAAFVAVAQFQKIEGAIEFGQPPGVHDLPPRVVNLHNGPWTQQRNHHPIFQADKSVSVFLKIQLAQQSRRDLAPGLHQAGEESGLLRPESGLKADRKTDRPRRIAGLDGEKVGG